MRLIEALVFTLADIVTGLGLLLSLWFFYQASNTGTLQAPTFALLGIGALLFPHVLSTAAHRHFGFQRQVVADLERD